MRSLEPKVTEGPRADILDVVLRFPGTHLRGIERQTGLPLGQVLYHLDRLERMGLVNSVRDAGFRRYYQTSAVSRAEKPVLAALRHEVPRRIVLHLLAEGELAHKELLGRLGLAGSTLSFHLQRLLASGVLVRVRDRNGQRYRLAQPEVARHDLVQYRDSFDDPAVDRLLGASRPSFAARTNALLVAGANAEPGTPTWSSETEPSSEPPSTPLSSS